MQLEVGQLRRMFFEETSEHLASLEHNLLHLEQTPHDKELLDDIFRSVHSIKGGSAVFSFDELTEFTHVFEGVLGQLRDGELQPTWAIVDLLLRATDEVKALVSAAQQEGAPPPSRLDLLRELEHMRSNPAPLSASATPVAAGQRDVMRERVIYLVTFIPSERVLRLGLNPLLALEDLGHLGTVSDIHVDTSRLPALAEMEPEQAYLGWTVQVETDKTPAEIRDVFAFFEGDCELRIEPVGDHTSLTTPCEEPVTSFVPDPYPVDIVAPSVEANSIEPGVPPLAVGLESSSIRVPVERANHLIDLVGEMVISQSMIVQILNTFSPEDLPRLQDAVAEMARNTRELQERVMAVRMLPIGTIFQRFPRLVRDLSRTFGKRITLHLSGEETELDKSVIERLSDPLTHLIRNAMDHGIEMPEVRRRAGKPEQGTIRIHAYHQGGNVIVEVSDDGSGLDTQGVRQRALERNLIRASEELSIEQIHALIFRPGFSTAKEVNAMSGRGVGLDVVKRNVEAANGTVSVQSEGNQGTRFRLKLPLTLAILDGLLLRVGAQTYILPLTTIIESFRPHPEQLKTIFGQGEVVGVRGEFLPLLRLHRLLNLTATAPDPTKGLVVIVEHEGRLVSLLVDEVVGQQQVVIKSLEANFRRMEGIAGATILGDGQVGLILDVAGIMTLARAKNGTPKDASADRAAP